MVIYVFWSLNILWVREFYIKSYFMDLVYYLWHANNKQWCFQMKGNVSSINKRDLFVLIGLWNLKIMGGGIYFFKAMKMIPWKTWRRWLQYPLGREAKEGTSGNIVNNSHHHSKRGCSGHLNGTETPCRVICIRKMAYIMVRGDCGQFFRVILNRDTKP